MSDIITGTPADLTYGHWLVQEAWLAVWIITSAALAIIIGWIGLSLILQEPLGSRQSGLAGADPQADPRHRCRGRLALVVRARH